MQRENHGTGEVLGRNVKSLREMKGLTKKKLAEMAGTSRLTVANIETCRYESTRTTLIEAIARVLGVTAGELLTGEPKKPAPKPRPSPKPAHS